jgi:Bacterial Ig-like domain (group 3)
MVGNSVTFTATVNGTAPTGAVDFTDGGTSLTGCSAVTLSGSGNTRTATCIAAALGAGAHGIAATYAGDSANVGSSSGLMTQTVLVISSTVIATSSTPTSLGSVATFTATVAGNAPTGTVAFKDGAAAIANCTMAPLTGSGNSRNAVCNTTGLAIGSHSITAVYSGDGINVGSASTAVTQDVNAASGGAPTLQTAASRKTHGAAGTFDLPLSLVPTNPGTEPRAGPTATVVLTFNKPLTAATVTITEGVATAAAPTFSGNDVVVDLTGVTDQQYVMVALSNVQSADGFTGSGSVRLGFLAGDVNQSRVVSLADLGLVNAAQAQVVNAANFILDINASGTLTVADKAITAGSLTRALPAP